MPAPHGTVELDWKVFPLTQLQPNMGRVIAVKTRKLTEGNYSAKQFVSF